MADNSLNGFKHICPDAIKTKFKRFLSALPALVGDETNTALVEKFIQNLIDGVIEPKEFSPQLQKEFKCSSQPFLAPFLEDSLPHIRLALISGTMSIKGVRPPPVQSLAPTAQVMKTKFQTFFGFLIRSAAGESTKTASIVKKLVQNIIDGVIEPEEFLTQIQKALKGSHHPYLIRFLKKALPHVRQALISGEMMIEGIRPPPVSAPTTEDPTTDIDLKAIADYLIYTSVVRKIMLIREIKKDAAVRREMKAKLDSLAEENSSNLKEKARMMRDILVCIELEKQRSGARRVVTLNRRRGQLKKVWESRGLRVEEDSLQVASSKDVFDMSSLDKALPSKPCDSDKRKVAEKCAKEYLSFMEEKMRSLRRSDIFRILVSNASEQNNESSATHCQSKSLTRMVKKVSGDVKNARIFSFRPLIKSNSSASERVSCPEFQKLHAIQKEEKDKRRMVLDWGSSLQNGPLKSEEVTYRMGREMLVLLKSPCANAGEKRSNVRKDDVNTENNLQNPELCLFNKDRKDDKQQRVVSLQKQQLHDSISLSRQLSRLKITNSRRGEDMDESEIQEASADQNENEQEKVTVANRRREAVEKLRQKYRQHKLKHEIETLNKN